MRQLPLLVATNSTTCCINYHYLFRQIPLLVDTPFGIGVCWAGLISSGTLPPDRRKLPPVGRSPHDGSSVFRPFRARACAEWLSVASPICPFPVRWGVRSQPVVVCAVAHIAVAPVGSLREQRVRRPLHVRRNARHRLPCGSRLDRGVQEPRRTTASASAASRVLSSSAQMPRWISEHIFLAYAFKIPPRNNLSKMTEPDF